MVAAGRFVGGVIRVNGEVAQDKAAPWLRLESAPGIGPYKSGFNGEID